MDLAGKLDAKGPRLGGKMKKIGLLLVLFASVAALAQSDSAATPEKTQDTTAGFPVERVQTPTAADLYCAGFVNKQLLPNANFVAGGLQTPNTTKFVNG